MKSEVLQLVADLSQGQADLTIAETYYDDLIFEMGLSGIPTCVHVVYLETFVGQGLYDLPDDLIEVLAVGVNQRELPRATIGELWQFAPAWRGLVGPPATWSTDDTIPRTTLLLVPAPDTASGPIAVDPFNRLFPANAITLLYSQNRDDAHHEEDLWMACEILAREFARDSDHTDHAVAQVFRGLAEFLRHLVEVDVAGWEH